jgi:hypothetical protein
MLAFTLGVDVVTAFALTIVPVLILRQVNLAPSFQSGARARAPDASRRARTMRSSYWRSPSRRCS